MKNHDLTRRYARAIYDLAEKQNLTTTIFEELNSVREIIKKEPRVLAFFLSPLISQDEKRAFIEKHLLKSSNALTSRFIDLLVEKHRIIILNDIVDELEDLLDVKNGISKATLVSAHPISEELIRPFKAALERFSKTKVLLKTRVEHELIGGVQIRINNYLLDNSLKNRLNQLRYQLQTMRMN